MTINEKISQLVSIVNDLINNSKNIGQLEAHDPEYDPSDSYIAIYNGATQETKKAAVDELLSILSGGVPAHEHSWTDVTGIGDFKMISIPDENEVVWWVLRSIDDETGDSFKLNDIVKGFEDVAKTTYIEGIVVGATAVIPDDLYDAAKFFITNKKISI